MSSQRYVAVQEEVVDPSCSIDYENWIKHLIRTMREKRSGTRSWHAGKHNQSYYYAFPIGSLNDVGLESPFQLSSQDIGQQVTPLTASPMLAVSSTRLSVLERLDHYSYSPLTPIVQNPKFAFIDVHRVRADMQDEYDALIRTLVEAMGKTDYPFAWFAFRTIVGEGRTFYDSPRTYHYVVGFDNLYEFFERHWFGAGLEKALGTEGARQYSATEKRCLQGFESCTCRIRTDLSYRAYDE